MQLVRYLADLPYADLESGSVVTIGAFDGLHLAHVQLLDRVTATSRQRGLPSIVMSFEPTPKEFFAATRPPARLMRFREKFAALKATGIDIFYCPRFDATMRDITVDAFIRRILVHGLCVRHLVVGDDFRFARRREGGIAELKRVSGALDFTIEQLPSIIVDGVRVSSTAIRDALGCGDMATATALLGRPYRMSGKIVRGEKLGRQLGYPTANVDLRRRQSAVMGIYAARVHGLPGGSKDAVASVGARPTFAGTKPLLEVHIFDFDADIYGRYIDVDFIAYLRDQKRFDTVDELVAQMHCDAAQARKLLTGES